MHTPQWSKQHFVLGSEIHQVVAKALPSNLAYTSGPLGLHTDFPFDRYPPGVRVPDGQNKFSLKFYFLTSFAKLTFLIEHF